MTHYFLLKRMDLFRISVRQVFRKRKSNLGIILSIALGMAGVILILTMGDKVKLTLNEDLELLGGATVVKFWYQQGLSADERIQTPMEISQESGDAVRKIPGVASVSILTMASGYSTWEDHEISDYTLLGIDQYYWDVITVKAIKGTFFGGTEVEERERVCVLGEELARKIFGSIDVVGTYLPIRRSLYRVTGILGGANAGDKANCAYIPFSTINDRVESVFPTRMYVRCKTWDDVPGVVEKTPNIIINIQGPGDLQMDVPWGPLKHLKRIVFWVELFIILSVSATLVIGGFGIWNGMMTSVKSRTREIGLKKAMGAEDGDILFQFLTEAVTLSFSAAILGILLGRGAIAVACWLLDTQASEMLFLSYSALSLGFSLFLGVVAGFYPALRASHMEVVSAIRYE